MGECRTVAPAGIEPAPSRASTGRSNLPELESRGREAGTRTPSAWSQTRRANPYATSRGWIVPASAQSMNGTPHLRTGKQGLDRVAVGANEWRRWESNPLRQRLQGVPGALPVTPSGPQDGACGPFLGAHTVEMSTIWHVHPAGWCSARVEGVEPSLPALETGGVTVRYTRLPMQLKTARWGLPCGRFLAVCLLALPRNLPGRPPVTQGSHELRERVRAGAFVSLNG